MSLHAGSCMRAHASARAHARAHAQVEPGKEKKFVEMLEKRRATVPGLVDEETGACRE